MSKKLFLLLITGIGFSSLYAQTFSPKQSWEVLKSALPPADFKPQDLRNLISEVDYNSTAEYKGVKIRRTGRFRDCLRIENPLADWLAIEVSETVLLYFIQYQEWQQSLKNKVKPSQSDTYQASLVSY